MGKEIKDYLHLYLGCECVVEQDLEMEGFETRTLTTASILGKKNQFLTLIGGSSVQKPFAAEEIKPILRPLSDMTEEEMIGLLQSMVPQDMETKPTDEDYDLEMFRNDEGLMVDGDVAVGANITCICYVGQIAIRESGDIDMFDEDGKPERVINQPAGFHYLLSKHFDLFGLIESGLAIDKTKQLNPHD